MNPSLPAFMTHRFFFHLLLVLLLCSLTSCGKQGNPQPQDGSRAFEWEGVAATPYDARCLAITGKLSGAYENLDLIKVELAAVNGPEDCPGCPFVAKEDVLFSPVEANLDSNDGSVSFSHCPRPAKSYRWRLIGINKYTAISHAISYEQLTKFFD